MGSPRAYLHRPYLVLGHSNQRQHTEQSVCCKAKVDVVCICAPKHSSEGGIATRPLVISTDWVLGCALEPGEHLYLWTFESMFLLLVENQWTCLPKYEPQSASARSAVSNFQGAGAKIACASNKQPTYLSFCAFGGFLFKYAEYLFGMATRKASIGADLHFPQPTLSAL